MPEWGATNASNCEQASVRTCLSVALFSGDFDSDEPF